MMIFGPSYFSLFYKRILTRSKGGSLAKFALVPHRQCSTFRKKFYKKRFFSAQISRLDPRSDEVSFFRILLPDHLIFKQPLIVSIVVFLLVINVLI